MWCVGSGGHACRALCPSLIELMNADLGKRMGNSRSGSTGERWKNSGDTIDDDTALSLLGK